MQRKKSHGNKTNRLSGGSEFHTIALPAGCISMGVAAGVPYPLTIAERAGFRQFVCGRWRERTLSPWLCHCQCLFLRLARAWPYTRIIFT